MFDKTALIEQEIEARIKDAFGEGTVVPNIKVSPEADMISEIKSLSDKGAILIAYTNGINVEQGNAHDRNRKNFIITFSSKNKRERLFEWMQIVHSAINRWKPQSASTPLLYVVDRVAARVEHADSHIAEIMYRTTIKDLAQ